MMAVLLTYTTNLSCLVFTDIIDIINSVVQHWGEGNPDNTWLFFSFGALSPHMHFSVCPLVTCLLCVLSPHCPSASAPCCVVVPEHNTVLWDAPVLLVRQARAWLDVCELSSEGESRAVGTRERGQMNRQGCTQTPQGQIVALLATCCPNFACHGCSKWRWTFVLAESGKLALAGYRMFSPALDIWIS